MAGRLHQPDLVCANCLVKMRDLDCFVKLRRCPGCKLVHYCSAVCETEHWQSNHESVCKIFSRKKKISKTNREEEFCSRNNYWFYKNVLLKVYWEKFGYHVKLSEDSTREQDYPWQCPYQLGESTGKYLGWVDEYLAKITEFLIRKASKYGYACQPLPPAVFDYSKKNI